MKKLFVILIVLFVAVAALMYRPSVSQEKLNARYTDEFSHFMEIEGMNVHYRKSGEGFPLLLIHGTSSSLHTWIPWQEQLSKHFTVYSMDLPGCGLTGPHPEDDYSIVAFLEFLEEFTSTLGIDSFYIAGNSLGGHISWEYAAASDKIKKAILVDPSGFYEEDRKLPFAFQLGRKKFFATIVEGLNVKPLIAKSLKEVYYNDELVSNDLKQRYFDLIRLKGNRRAFIKKVGYFEFSPEEELHAIDIPVLIQWGREDLWIPLELADIFTDNLANNQLIIYDNCGHVPQEEVPDRSAQDAMSFLLANQNLPL